jgi:hypothetical protein
MDMSGKALALLAGVVGLGVALLVAGYLGPAPVQAQTPATAHRYFSSSTVPAGGELVVTVTARGYGRFGQVVETLPAGFTYMSSNQPGVEARGQVVMLPFLMGDTVTYRVTAPAVAGADSFTGVLKDEDKSEVTVGGQSQATTAAVGQSLLDRYDINPMDGSIGRDEYLEALDNYISGAIDRDAYLEVLDLYINALQVSQ